MTDSDREESAWLCSGKDCEGCSESIKFGEKVVILRLVYLAPCNGELTLLDALNEDDGSYAADPVLFCFFCWDAYAEDLRAHLNELFITRTTDAGPTPRKCSFCQTAINWGDYCGHSIYGELDSSPRTGETTFQSLPYETAANAELICMDCLQWINEELGECIWSQLWEDEEGLPDEEALQERI